MTALRQSAIMELEKKEAFARLEQLCRKGTIADYDAELASYREEKYEMQFYQVNI